MLKLIGRYFIALVMIPVGVALGVLGVAQNYLRREHYRRRNREIAAQTASEQRYTDASS
ncbi:MAG: hypothetical protein P9L99_10790 [Candidatus Lernaella stagnicola]|nr:hypothetical protein [Candidatus Lernaella stagnicola]